MKKSKTVPTAFDGIVIGGGAAGMLAAATAAFSGANILLLEKNRRYGWKLSLTGKGRCNVTNNCPPEEVLRNIPTNPRFLYSSVWGFPPSAVMAYFEALGVPLKTERGGRVFPQSDRAGDIVSALERNLDLAGVCRRQETARSLLLKDGAVRGVQTDRGVISAARVILATGGLSYPATGSTGDGYALARQAGHTVGALSGSLVPLEVQGGCRSLAGLNLRNTGLTLWGRQKKPVYRDFGELLFMNYGLSGPTVLSASAHMNDKDGPYAIELDLKPALEEQKLDARLLRDFADRKNENIYEGLRGLLPGPLVPVVLERSGVPASVMVHDVTRQQRKAILETVKHLQFPIVGKRPVEEAIVTHGGVKVSEVDPATMESRLVRGLYFAGELLDVDGYTGGFNLQIAWSTGYAAGTSCGNSHGSVL